MKKIGLVGGMTPESTVEYYRAIIELGRRHWDDPLHNPVVLIYSIDLAEIVAHQDVGDDDRVLGDAFAAVGLHVAVGGLGSVDRVDALRVRWSDGSLQDVEPPAVDQSLLVEQP